VPLILNTQSGNFSPQFHCIYDEEFATCKQDAKSNSLWQYKAKLQSKAFSVDHVDALPTADKLTKSIVLPDAADPLPRFVEPWDSSPEPEPTEFDTQPDKHGNAANQPSVETTTRPASAPERDTPTDVDKTATRSGRTVRKPYYFSDYLAHSAFSTYLHTFSLQQQTEDALHLLQPDHEGQCEPHPLALIADHVMAFIGSDPTLIRCILTKL
jgi:hypothetical protein